jgi:hypothetical protein
MFTPLLSPALAGLFLRAALLPGTSHLHKAIGRIGYTAGRDRPARSRGVELYMSQAIVTAPAQIKFEQSSIRHKKGLKSP